jgi:hypothetical protein
MARKQSRAQKATIGRVMHEYKHGELERGRGGKVRNPRQAVAIALHEAGVARDQAKGPRRKAAARQPAAGAAGGRGRRGTGPTRAQLLAEARRRDVPGRSRMSKAELARALARRR